MPRVEVRFFAQLRERFGVARSERVRGGTTAKQLWARIRGADPALDALSVRFAVAERYVDDDHVLEDGDELAIFPPVSGG